MQRVSAQRCAVYVNDDAEEERNHEMKKIVAVMLILGLMGCVPSWSQACESTYAKLQIIRSVRSEQSRMVKESPGLKEQNIRLDRLAEMSVEQSKLMDRYIKDGIKK